MKKFYHMTLSERLDFLKKNTNFTENDLSAYRSNVDDKIGNALIENFFGYFNLPTGLVFDLNIDNKSYTVPMVVEETSIIAALNSAVKISNLNGTISTKFEKRHIVGQIYYANLSDITTFIEFIKKNKSRYIHLLNLEFYSMKKRGGGVKDIRIQEIMDNEDHFTRVHIISDPCDAMGANYINQVCEFFSKILEKDTGNKAILKILSNYSKQSVIKSQVTFSNLDRDFCEKIVTANKIAKLDPYRAVTHNKGIMNGIDSVLIATGNDWRAVEASCHAYASRDGNYRALTEWTYRDGLLIGELEIPILIGLKGGVADCHPQAVSNIKTIDVDNVEELTKVCAAIGLLQNFAALKSLVTVGIVQGHMNLHVNNIAMTTGAKGEQLDKLIINLKDHLKKNNKVGQNDARKLLENG